MSKPFLKWAGGKSRLIKKLENHFPDEIVRNKKIKKYFEPFIGGGALLIYLLQNYSIEKAYISDTNIDLINTYKVIQNNPTELIECLGKYQNLYDSTQASDRLNLFLKIREEFNNNFDSEKNEKQYLVSRAAQLIFLNKTCFNGLYRLNLSGKFNVPFGKYNSPKIADGKNILALSQLFKNTDIQLAPYQDCLKEIDINSFIYLDPPYKPISKTSNFNNYTKASFGDTQQKILAEFCKLINAKGSKFLLSNSAPDNNFFENLYSDFKLNKIQATRSINSKGNLRGLVDELVIKNYQ